MSIWKKCSFIQTHVLFLGFIISAQGVATNPKKISIILEWPKPKAFFEVQSFQGLVFFYKRFIRGFSSIMAPIIDCLKKCKFSWTLATTTKAFADIKTKMTIVPVLRHPDFSKPCKVTYDAFGIGIRGILSRGSTYHLFNWETYSTYDKGLYAIVQCLKY